MSQFVPIKHPFIDSSKAPIYLMSFGATTTDDELRACCAAREAWAEIAKHKVSWVVDLSRVMDVTAKQRRIFAEHLTRFEPHDVAYNQGSALIVPNTFIRGVLTAIFWLKPPRFPHQTFMTRAEAFAWAEERIRGDGATQPTL